MQSTDCGRGEATAREGALINMTGSARRALQPSCAPETVTVGEEVAAEMEQVAVPEDKRLAKKRAAEKRAAEAAARRQLRRENTRWPSESAKVDPESSGPRQRWLCFAMFGASAVIAVMLGLRLLFALQPVGDGGAGGGVGGGGDEAAGENVDEAQWTHGSFARDAMEEPSGCGGMCGHVLCTGATRHGGAPAALRDYFNRSWYLVSCTTSEEDDPDLRLVIRDSHFPDSGALQPGWLDSRLRVADLQLTDCGLRTLADGAFQSPTFAHTHALSLEGNAISQLQAGAFEGLRALKLLIFRRNLGLKFISPLTLLPVASSLHIITVQSALTHPQFITNLTGSIALPHVEYVDFNNNDLIELDSYSFLGLSGVESISVQDCALQRLGDGLFDTVSNSLQVFHLDRNKLESLSEKTFAPIVNSTRFTHLGLSENPWNCSCSFEWIKTFSYAWKIDQGVLSPTCASPSRNKDVSLYEARFCPDGEDFESEENASDDNIRVLLVDSISRDFTPRKRSYYKLPKTISPTTEEANVIQIYCGDSLGERNTTISVHKDKPTSIYFNANGTSVYVPLRSRVFTITRIDGTSIEVSLPKSDEEEMLYWHPQNLSYPEVELPDIGCQIATNDSLTVHNLRPQQVYVVCLVNATNPSRASGLQCMSVQTAAQALSNKIPVAPSVASNGNSGLVIAICTLVFLLSGLTLYVAYGFLCTKQKFEQEQAAWLEPNWSSVEMPRMKDEPEPRRIFWISESRRGSVIDGVRQ